MVLIFPIPKCWTVQLPTARPALYFYSFSQYFSVPWLLTCGQPAPFSSPRSQLSYSTYFFAIPGRSPYEKSNRSLKFKVCFQLLF